MSGKIGIRREDRNRWERRAPLAPLHVARLVSSGVEVVVQPSEIRIFSDEEYLRSGAAVSEDLSDCSLVLAIKEIPGEYFRPGGAYLFFSHVSKGQPYNMGMLGRVLECGASLLDYEHMVDPANRRLVFFGNHPGAAGLFETLHALGRRLEWEGQSTPLSSVQRPLEFSSLEEGRKLLAQVGRRISEAGMGESLAPVIVGFAGYGNVSGGAQELFDLLPHEEISPDNLRSFMAAGKFSERKLYKVVFKEEDMVVPIEASRPFDLEDYYSRPGRYRGKFEEYLPHLTVLINCIYWEEKYPRLVTRDWLRSAWTASRRSNGTGPRLRVIGDITCDIEGSIECTLKATDPSMPAYTYIPSSGDIVDGCEGEGVVVMAVDTLPAELPREASQSFGDMLYPYVPELASADFSKTFDALELGEVLQRAVIAHCGQLTQRYRYLQNRVTSERNE